MCSHISYIHLSSKRVHTHGMRIHLPAQAQGHRHIDVSTLLQSASTQPESQEALQACVSISKIEIACV
jgi:hypothetical protein